MSDQYGETVDRIFGHDPKVSDYLRDLEEKKKLSADDIDESQPAIILTDFGNE